MQVNDVEMFDKTQDQIASLLRNIEVGSVASLTVSRQTSDDQGQGQGEGQPSTSRPLDSTDSQQPYDSAPSVEPKEKRSNNGASSPELRCFATSDSPVLDNDLELVELSIAVDGEEDDPGNSSVLGVSIKGIKSGHEDHGLVIKRIVDGGPAAKVSLCSPPMIRFTRSRRAVEILNLI